MSEVRASAKEVALERREKNTITSLVKIDFDRYKEGGGFFWRT